MKVEKHLVINIGGYESLRIGVSEALNYHDCDQILINELKRINIPLTNKIKQILQWSNKK